MGNINVVTRLADQKANFPNQNAGDLSLQIQIFFQILSENFLHAKNAFSKRNLENVA